VYNSYARGEQSGRDFPFLAGKVEPDAGKGGRKLRKAPAEGEERGVRKKKKRAPIPG